MRFLRDVIIRNPVSRYFAQLERVDRVTFWVVTALALAFALSVHVLWQRYDRPEPMVPAFSAPPFDMRTVRA